MDNMDIRTPDSYTTETLVDFEQHSSQDISCHELEIAMLQSMEEAWVKEAQCAAVWASFQPVLERLKRVGYYEPEFRKIYDLLSIHLYKYSYDVEDFMSEETCQWIEEKLITVRLSILEKEQITKALNPYRSTRPRSGL
jgi:hypothetical protein